MRRTPLQRNLRFKRRQHQHSARLVFGVDACRSVQRPSPCGKQRRTPAAQTRHLIGIIPRTQRRQYSAARPGRFASAQSALQNGYFGAALNQPKCAAQADHSGTDNQKIRVQVCFQNYCALMEGFAPTTISNMEIQWDFPAEIVTCKHAFSVSSTIPQEYRMTYSNSRNDPRRPADYCHEFRELTPQIPVNIPFIG